jgi:zinc-ribbon domain
MDRVLESESILKRLSESWWSHDHPRRGRSYTCQCGRSVFFRDGKCRACGAPLGYDAVWGGRPRAIARY